MASYQITGQPNITLILLPVVLLLLCFDSGFQPQYIPGYLLTNITCYVFIFTNAKFLIVSLFLKFCIVIGKSSMTVSDIKDTKDYRYLHENGYVLSGVTLYAPLARTDVFETRTATGRRMQLLLACSDLNQQENSQLPAAVRVSKLPSVLKLSKETIRNNVSYLY